MALVEKPSTICRAAAQPGSPGEIRQMLCGLGMGPWNGGAWAPKALLLVVLLLVVLPLKVLPLKVLPLKVLPLKVLLLKVLLLKVLLLKVLLLKVPLLKVLRLRTQLLMELLLMELLLMVLLLMVLLLMELLLMELLLKVPLLKVPLLKVPLLKALVLKALLPRGLQARVLQTERGVLMPAPGRLPVQPRSVQKGSTAAAGAALPDALHGLSAAGGGLVLCPCGRCREPQCWATAARPQPKAYRTVRMHSAQGPKRWAHRASSRLQWIRVRRRGNPPAWSQSGPALQLRWRQGS